MSMATRCPACTTTFRVTPQQLQAHDGKVRCGRCAHVFDGFLALTTLSDTDTPLMPTPSAQSLPSPALPELAEVSKASREPEAVPVAEKADLAARAAQIPDVLLTSTVGTPTPPEFVPASSPPVAPLAATAPPTRRAAWAVGSVLLLAGLITQGAYGYRSELAGDYPQLRAPLDKMCAALGCVVGLPQRPDLIKIEAFDMQALDAANPGWLRMTATLRNHAAVDLGYPALDVVLTDANDQRLVRRIFLPAEYLPPNQPAQAGIAANAELLVQLDLDTGTLGAAGFRPDLRAAPLR